jgi:hypothetical protein
MVRITILIVFAFGLGAKASEHQAELHNQHKKHTQSPRLNLDKGRMAVSGRAQVNYFSSEASYYGGFYAQIDAAYSYFLVDNFALGVGLNAASQIDRIAVAPALGLNVAAEYFFDTNSIAVPYLGANLGIGYKPLDPTSKLWLPVRPQVGVLIALSDSVALDLGINTTFTFPLLSDVEPLLEGTAGMVGVRAFF